jgi:c-di-GMP-related signal transduction protein
MRAFVARQPILDRDQGVVAYELLFRAGQDNAFPDGADGDLASASVMSDALHVHEFMSLADGRKCFINITRHTLVRELYTTLPPDSVVLELVETVKPDAEVVDCCRRLRRSGYTLALDDYVLDHAFDDLLPVAHILKADFMAADAAKRMQIAETGRTFGLQLLAEKVETHEDFSEACELGYGMFQGYFFCKPEIIERRDLPPNRAAYARLLQEINKPALDLGALDGIIRSDTALSYRLLRFLNSAAFGFRSDIKSVRHGLSLLGDRPLKKWISLIVLSRINEDKPLELLITSLVRARFCESMAAPLGMCDRESDLFMLGMFSLLDAMLDRPMEELLKSMALSDEIRAGLLGHDPAVQPILDLAIAHERGEWREVFRITRDLGANPDETANAHHRAIQWVSGMRREMGAEDKPARKVA